MRCPSEGSMVQSLRGQEDSRVKGQDRATYPPSRPGPATRKTQSLLNAWCELRSPLQQISDESQPRTTKLLVEPDTEIVQRYPRRQASSQAFQLMGPLPPEAEGIEELVVDRLDDLAYSSYPSSQALGPVPLAGV